MSELTLFVSHRSSDVGLARALVELFEKALKLPARQIRCTSVDGYRLPVGAATDEQLRREVFESRAFIGLITPASIASAYLLFELGARWGARKHLAPVLARGADMMSLGGPLGGINALRLDERSQVIQLLEDIAELLQLQLEPGPSYQFAIDSVIAEARKPISAPSFEPTAHTQEEPELDAWELDILALVAHGVAEPKDVAAKLEIPIEKANYYLQRLIDAKLIHNIGGVRKFYKVLQRGREYLVKGGHL
jgi:hypothetical protein